MPSLSSTVKLAAVCDVRAIPENKNSATLNSAVILINITVLYIYCTVYYNVTQTVPSHIHNICSLSYVRLNRLYALVINSQHMLIKYKIEN